MSDSLPSRPVVSLDIPEVGSFRADFVYSFFTPDERTNELNSVPGYLVQNPVFASDVVAIDSISKKVPRSIKFSFSPVLLSDDQNLNNFNNLSFTITNNFSKIVKEENFTNFGFTGLDIQDTGIDGKFYILLSGTVARRISDNNLIAANSVNEEIENIGSYIDSNNVSLLDVAKYLNGQTDIDVPEQLVINSLNNLQVLGASFVDDEGIKEKLTDAFEKVKAVKTRIRINNRILSRALKTSANDSLGIFSDEIGPLLPAARAIQNKLIKDFPANTIDAAEYDIVVNPIKQVPMPANTLFKPVRKIIGYIIDKFELAENGKLIEKDPIIIENQHSSFAIDYKIRYGAKYVYQIRTVSQVVFQTSDLGTDDLVASYVLISSSPSPRIVVDCIENIPPPPPADFDVSWDSKNKAARLMWAFPPNPQRDIKKFQIFKRGSVYDPYQLIKEIDFDDSEIKTQSFETPNIQLIEKVNSAKTFFLDRTFSRSASCIYTLCSIDAHGMTSNYSIQYQVSFDRFKNKIYKKLISNSGAPKPYPNMYLQQDTFVDVIKDSGHSRMTIYFDPEYYSVFFGDAAQKDLNLLNTDKQNGSYVLQFINVDLQKSKKIDIILEDRRTTINKNQSPNKMTYTPLSKLGIFKNIPGK